MVSVLGSRDEFLRILYDYNYWAHRRLLDTAARLTDAQRRGHFAHGQPAGLLAHQQAESGQAGLLPQRSQGAKGSRAGSAEILWRCNRSFRRFKDFTAHVAIYRDTWRYR